MSQREDQDGPGYESPESIRVISWPCRLRGGRREFRVACTYAFQTTRETSALAAEDLGERNVVESEKRMCPSGVRRSGRELRSRLGCRWAKRPTAWKTRQDGYSPKAQRRFLFLGDTSDDTARRKAQRDSSNRQTRNEIAEGRGSRSEAAGETQKGVQTDSFVAELEIRRTRTGSLLDRAE